MKHKSSDTSYNIHPARRVIGGILTVLIALFTVYLSVIMIYRIATVALKGAYIGSFAIELVLCGSMLLLALDIRTGFLSHFRSKPAKITGMILRILAAAVTALTLFLCGKAVAGGMMKTDGEAGYTVVLGLALKDGKPSDDLIARIDTAKEYLDANPDTTLILTGGNPGSDGRTEAAVMHDLLAERGVPEEKMKLEDNASTTVGNFANTAKIIGTDETIAIVTSNYHMDRAVSTALKAGFKNILSIPANSDIMQYGANIMWEAAARIIAVFTG